MKKLLQISLGIVTSIGGFLEAGSLATSIQAGSAFGYQLIWTLILGTICLIFLVEMSGRFAAISKHTIIDGVREHFGFSFLVLPFIAISIVNLLVLGAEIGGICIALQLVTGIAFQLWSIPVTFVVWFIMWKGTFGIIENGISILGLVTVCFVVAVFWLQPSWSDVLKGIVPALPDHDGAKYWYLAVGILGATISPYLFFFYSAGAIEDKWDKGYLGVNRAVAVLGMSFGGTISLAALILGALVFLPRGMTAIENYDQIAIVLTPVFGLSGFYLFAASLGIACLGAAAELALIQAYLVAQTFGWEWGEDLPPRKDPAFSLSYTICVILGGLLILVGLDPLRITVFSMALTAMVLPIAVIPFLLLMNDSTYLGKHTNGWIGNMVVILIVGLGFVLAVGTLPLQFMAG
jgi:Mn2+/Fe2+ NRAMP family transporter